MQQLDLIDLGLKPIIKHTFENYIVAQHNDQIVAHLKYLIQQTLSGQPSSNYLYLWGQSGTGKTHLLQAVCEEACLDNNVKAAYFSFKDHADVDSAVLGDILESFESQDLICLDDLNLINHHQDHEELLFGFYNRIKDANKTLIIASDCSVTSLNIGLADLQSRLASGVSYHLKTLDDQDKKNLLMTCANERGMTLSGEVADYLITHGRRDIVGLFEMLDKLDKASIQYKRKLSIPFAKEILF